MEPHIRVGVLVVVPFGKRKLLTGIVVAIHEIPPVGYQARYIDTLLDSKPIVHEVQLNFWRWMSSYYMCFMGEILLAALPAGLRLSSETSYQLNPAFDGDLTTFTEREKVLLEALAAREVMSPDEISELLQVKAYQPAIKKLLAAGAVLVMEDLKERYKPRYDTFVRLTPACDDEDGLQAGFRLLERAPKQQEVLMMYVQLSKRYTGEPEEVKKTMLQKFAGCTAVMVAELVRKGVLEIYERETSRLPNAPEDGKVEFDLSPSQQNAYNEVLESVKTKPVTLLHGITSSGKTEIFVKLVKEVLARGKQVLYILPEIALTTQMIVRLQRYFGNQVLVYHSRFNQNERVEVWNMVLRNESTRGKLILGARSAVFLPFSDLGLVIVDEEHEPSFKQHDPAPRYHARDAAIVLASLHNAPVVLGSATPAFETMHNALRGKYGYVQINERFGGMALPEVKPLLLSKATAPSGYFTETLIAAIKETLASKEQVILFQNRRGYAPILVCTTCGWTPECVRCDVSATFHKSLERLVCHYCGNRYNVPPECPKCGSHKLKLAGFGTERIEEELEIIFPDAKIARLDLDSARSKHAYQQILGDFQDGSIDVLIGTQMVTKGLDFGRVNLVGVLNADLLLKFPDFRSVERAYQLMTQVAGRAGRRQKRGLVYIQSQNPGHWVIAAVMNGKYMEVYEREMDERQKFKYPPFTRLLLLIFRHQKLELTDFCAAEYAKELSHLLPKHSILGPEYPQVARVKNRYNKHLLLKIDPDVHLGKFKEQLTALNHRFFAQKQFNQVRLIINIDPQ
jgi:primosomal protein N' (replication factor Y)